MEEWFPETGSRRDDHKTRGNFRGDENVLIIVVVTTIYIRLNSEK